MKTKKALNEELLVAATDVLVGFNLGRYQAIIFEDEDPDGPYYEPVEKLGAAILALKDKDVTRAENDNGLPDAIRPASPQDTKLN